MGRKLNFFLNLSVWAALAAYLVVATRYCSRQEEGLRCTGHDITVKDSAQLGFITPYVVRNILVSENIALTGRPLDSLNLLAVERAVGSRAYVKGVRAYASMDGKVNIEVEQRRPLLRIRTESGYDAYVSEDGYVLPVQTYFFVDVPVVTGEPPLPFGRDFVGRLPDSAPSEKKEEKSELFLYNLINFVKFLREDPFWNLEVVQINALRNGELELIPRVGNHVILLGEAEGYREKLSKLLRFYRRGLPYEGWNRYRYMNVKYKDQVVCIK